MPFRVVVHLTHGYCASDPWSPTLDSILAEQVLRARLGDEAFALGSTGVGGLTVLGPGELPLAVDRHGEAWWWCVSSPIAAPSARFPRFFHRRFDDAEAVDRVDERVRAVNEKGGPYRSYRVRREVILAPTLTWHAIGDPDETRRLVAHVTHVGSGRGKGYGQVADDADGLPWIEVTTAGADATLARALRPLPTEAAQARGLIGIPLRWGIRPPARLPAHQMLCLLPALRPQ